MSASATRARCRFRAALSGAALGTLLALAPLGAIGTLSGCGLKGALYLPPQKKAKVPATPGNPSAEPEPAPNAQPQKPAGGG